MKNLLFSYLLKEILPTFFTSLFVITSILLLGKMAPLTELLLKQGISFWSVLQIVVFALPHLLLFAIPMATLLGNLLTYTRMAKDREILAIKASGVSFYQILPPAVLVSVGAYLFTLFTALYAQPWGNYAMKNLIFKMLKFRADLSIREGEFSNTFKDVILYVQDIPEGRRLRGVYISDARNPDVSNTVVAREGWIVPQPERLALIFYLRDGSIHRIGKDRQSVQTIHFEKYALTLGKQSPGGSRVIGKGKSEMSLNEIRNRLKELSVSSPKYYSLLMEFHRRMALPVACLILGVIGAALGAQSKFAGTSFGVSIGLAVFLLYYLMLALAKGLGEAGIVYPAIGMWVPNFVFAIMAVYLIAKTDKERPIWFIELLQRLSERLEKSKERRG